MRPSKGLQRRSFSAGLGTTHSSVSAVACSLHSRGRRRTRKRAFSRGKVHSASNLADVVPWAGDLGNLGCPASVGGGLVFRGCRASGRVGVDRLRRRRKLPSRPPPHRVDPLTMFGRASCAHGRVIVVTPEKRHRLRPARLLQRSRGSARFPAPQADSEGRARGSGERGMRSGGTDADRVRSVRSKEPRRSRKCASGHLETPPRRRPAQAELSSRARRRHQGDEMP